MRALEIQTQQDILFPTTSFEIILNIAHSPKMPSVSCQLYIMLLFITLAA